VINKNFESKFFNDWFRDENLQPSIAVPVNDGPDSQSDYNIERSRKRKDYFTGCLPWHCKITSISNK
jgi:hypothetical protein